ncbi:MFS transporter [Gordonia humi]|uniref:MFS transporter n=1 Tax=Gordonia humi TaxID=686429 RepID=UPI003621E4C9
MNFLSSTAGVGKTESIILTCIGLIIYACLCPVAGRISDRIGRRKTILFGCAGHTILGIPLFMLLGTGSVAPVLIALVVYAIFQAPINANTSLILVEMFPASTRLTGGSVGFNLGVGAPSGFGPLIGASLVTATGLKFAPGVLPRRRRADLRRDPVLPASGDGRARSPQRTRCDEGRPGVPRQGRGRHERRGRRGPDREQQLLDRWLSR